MTNRNSHPDFDVAFLRRTARDRPPAARARRLPLGPRADARKPSSLPAGGDVRDAGRPRRRQPGEAARRAGRRAPADSAPRRDRLGERRIHDRRRHRRHRDEAGAATSARLRRDEGRHGGRGRPQVGGDQERGARRRVAAGGRAADAAGARLQPGAAGAGRRRRASSGRASRTCSTS